MEGKRKSKIIKAGAIATVSLLIFSLVLMLSVLGEQASWEEDFDDDTVGSDPSESWYTYSESGTPTKAEVVDDWVYDTQAFQFKSTGGTVLSKFVCDVGQNFTDIEWYTSISPTGCYDDFYVINNLSTVMHCGVRTGETTAGKTDVGGNLLHPDPNYMYGSRYNLPVDAHISSVKFYLKNTDAGDTGYISIYDTDGTDDPDTRMWMSDAFTSPTSYTWYTVYPEDLTLPAGDYYIMYCSNGDFWLKYSDSVKADAYVGLPNSYPPPATILSAGDVNRNISCYMSYYNDTSYLYVNEADTGVEVYKDTSQWYVPKMAFNYSTDMAYVTWWNDSSSAFDYTGWHGFVNSHDEIDSLFVGVACGGLSSNFSMDSLELGYWNDPPVITGVFPPADATDVWFNSTNEEVNLSFTITDPDGNEVLAFLMLYGTDDTLMFSPTNSPCRTPSYAGYDPSPQACTGTYPLERGEEYHYYIAYQGDGGVAQYYPSSSNFTIGTKAVYNFTVAENSVPTFVNNPANGTSGVVIQNKCGNDFVWFNSTISDSDDSDINIIYGYAEEGGNWTHVIPMLEKAVPYSFAGITYTVDYNTTYYWYLNVSDGAYRNITNTTYNHYPSSGQQYDGIYCWEFTTEEGDAPYVESYYPLNGSTLSEDDLFTLDVDCSWLRYATIGHNISNNESCEYVYGYLYYNSTFFGNTWSIPYYYSFTNSTNMTDDTPVLDDDVVYWYLTMVDGNGTNYYPANGTGVYNDGHWCYMFNTSSSPSPSISVVYPADGATYNRWQWGDPDNPYANHMMDITIADGAHTMVAVYFYADEIDDSYYMSASALDFEEDIDWCDTYTEGWVDDGTYTLDLSEYIYFNNMNYSIKVVAWDYDHTTSPHYPVNETVVWVNFTIGEYNPDIWWRLAVRDINLEHENWNELHLLQDGIRLDYITWSINSSGADDWSGVGVGNWLSYKLLAYNMSKVVCQRYWNGAWNTTYDPYSYISGWEVIAPWWHNQHFNVINLLLPRETFYSYYFGISLEDLQLIDADCTKEQMVERTECSALYDDALHVNFTVVGMDTSFATGAYITDNMQNESMFNDVEFFNYHIGLKLRFGTFPEGETPFVKDSAFDPEFTTWNEKLDNFEANSGFGSIRIIAGLLIVLIFSLFPYIATKDPRISSMMVGNQRVSSVGRKDVPMIVVVAFMLMGVMLAFGMGLFPIWVFIPPTIVFALIFVYKILNYAKARREEGPA